LGLTGTRPSGPTLSGVRTPNAGPPGTAWSRTRYAALFQLSGADSGIGRSLEFPMDFVGVTVAAQFGQEGIGRLGVAIISAAMSVGSRSCQYWC